MKTTGKIRANRHWRAIRLLLIVWLTGGTALCKNESASPASPVNPSLFDRISLAPFSLFIPPKGRVLSWEEIAQMLQDYYDEISEQIEWKYQDAVKEEETLWKMRGASLQYRQQGPEKKIISGREVIRDGVGNFKTIKNGPDKVQVLGKTTTIPVYEQALSEEEKERIHRERLEKIEIHYSLHRKKVDLAFHAAIQKAQSYNGQKPTLAQLLIYTFHCRNGLEDMKTAIDKLEKTIIQTYFNSKLERLIIRRVAERFQSSLLSRSA